MSLLDIVLLHLQILSDQAKSVSPCTNLILMKFLNMMGTFPKKHWKREALSMVMEPILSLHFSTLNKHLSSNIQVHTADLLAKIEEVSSSGCPEISAVAAE